MITLMIMCLAGWIIWVVLGVCLKLTAFAIEVSILGLPMVILIAILRRRKRRLLR